MGISGAKGFGFNQNWVDVKASRNSGTSYLNNRNRAIAVSILLTNNDVSAYEASLSIGGTDYLAVVKIPANSSAYLTAIIPANKYYVLQVSSALITFYKWNEFV